MFYKVHESLDFQVNLSLTRARTRLLVPSNHAQVSQVDTKKTTKNEKTLMTQQMKLIN